MKIVIIRHGQTLANVINNKEIDFYTGALNNELTELTEYGKKQASKLAKDDIVKSIEKVYSSDLIRAKETAALAKPGYELILNEDLRERCLGIFEGKTKENLLNSNEYNKYITDDRFNKFRADFIQKAPGGENYTDVTMRSKKFINSLNFNKNITIGIFSHSHTIKCLFLSMLKINPKEKVFDLRIEQCVPYVIEGNGIENFKLISHDLKNILKKM